MFEYREKTADELRDEGYVFQGWTDYTRQYELWYNPVTCCRYTRRA